MSAKIAALNLFPGRNESDYPLVGMYISRQRCLNLHELKDDLPLRVIRRSTRCDEPPMLAVIHILNTCYMILSIEDYAKSNLA